MAFQLAKSVSIHRAMNQISAQGGTSLSKSLDPPLIRMLAAGALTNYSCFQNIDKKLTLIDLSLFTKAVRGCRRRSLAIIGF